MIRRSSLLLMRLGVALIFLAASFVASSALRAAPSTVALTHLSAVKFWALPAVQEVIDVDTLNRPLLVAAIFHETNRRRIAEGLFPFLPLDRLDDAADTQAAMIALRQQIGHENPLARLATPWLRVKDTGLEPEWVAENVAMTPLLNPPESRELFMRIENGRKIFSTTPEGPETPVHTYASFARVVLDQWMNSPGHRANIVNHEMRYLGCAARPSKNVNLRDVIYAVQVFFTPKKK